jgi:hypothetical protein
MFKLRPHHGMCIQHFVGKGYSNDFVANMRAIIEYLNRENPTVELVVSADEICKSCPNLIEGKCISESKVSKIDSACLCCCDLENKSLKYKDYKNLVNNKIIKSNKGKTICNKCQWHSLCYKMEN